MDGPLGKYRRAEEDWKKLEAKTMKYKNEKEAMDAGLKVIAFDFDGTLTEYDGWKDGVIGDPLLEGIGKLITKKELGAYIIIFTTRLNERLWGVERAALEKNRIVEWLACHNLSDCVDLIVGDKPLANEYHDDRAIPFKKEEGVYACEL